MYHFYELGILPSSASAFLLFVDLNLHASSSFVLFILLDLSLHTTTASSSIFVDFNLLHYINFSLYTTPTTSFNLFNLFHIFIIHTTSSEFVVELFIEFFVFALPSSSPSDNLDLMYYN